MARNVTCAVLAATLLMANAAAGQEQPAPVLAVAGGVVADESVYSGMFGGSILAAISERIALEAQGTYVDRGSGAEAFSLQGSILFNLLPPDQRVLPYVAGGGGVFHATFDDANPDFPWSLMLLHEFYGPRIGAIGEERWKGKSFTDPMLGAGGGIRVAINDTWSLRPDLRAVVVFGSGARNLMSVFTVHVGYRF